MKSTGNCHDRVEEIEMQDENEESNDYILPNSDITPDMGMYLNQKNCRIIFQKKIGIMKMILLMGYFQNWSRKMQI